MKTSSDFSADPLHAQRQLIVNAAIRSGASQPMGERIAAQVEREMRRIYQGSSVYIPQIGRQQLAERDDCIRRAYRHGELIPSLALRFCLSERRVRQILEASSESR